MDTMSTEAKFPENGRWPEVPTGPCERRISIHVSGVNDGTGIEKQLNRLLGAEGGGSVERRLGFCPAVPHEAPCFSGRFRRAIWIRPSGEEHFHDVFTGWVTGLAQGRVQRGLAGIGQGKIRARAMLDDELAKLPVPMKCSSVQIVVLTQCLD